MIYINKKILKFGFLVLLTFLLVILPIYSAFINSENTYQNQSGQNTQKFKTNNTTPQIQSESIILDYSIIYNITENGDSYSDIVPLNLTIQGNEGLLENGSINYDIPKNISDEGLLQSLSLIFFNDQISYMQNHDEGEKYETFFSYRKEALTNNPNDLEVNGSYLFFWICDLNHPPSSLHKYQNIPFTKLSYNIPIKEDNYLLTYLTWESDSSLFPNSQKLIETLYLKSSQSISGEYDYIIRLYYDSINAVLLKAECYYNDIQNGKTYFVDIVLRNTSLIFDLIDNIDWNGSINTEPVISQPGDLEFFDDTLEPQIIMWEIVDNTTFYPSYIIYHKNGQIGPILWTPNTPIQIDVTNYADGSWEIILLFNDGLGEISMDSIKCTIYPVAPILNHPDDIIYYSNSSVEYFISWLIIDNSIYDTFFNISLSTIDKTILLENGGWTSEHPIQYNVTKFPIGIWNLTISISDGSSAPLECDTISIIVLNDTLDVNQKNYSPFIFIPRNITLFTEYNKTIGFNWMIIDYNNTLTCYYNLFINEIEVLDNIIWVSGDIHEFNLSSFLPGLYQFYLIVFDGWGEFSEINFTITIKNTRILGNNNSNLSKTVIFDSPDLFYYADSTEYFEIAWILINFFNTQGVYYITLNSSRFSPTNTTWMSGDKILVNVSRLNPGQYNYEIFVNDNESLATSLIQVWVFPADNQLSSNYLYFLIPIPAIGFISLGYFFYKKKNFYRPAKI